MSRTRTVVVVLLVSSACLSTKGTAPNLLPATEQPPVAQPTVPEVHRCGATFSGGAKKELAFAGRVGKQDGARLTFSEPDADGRLVLGVLGPINEDSGANLVALKKYRSFFVKEKADAIIVTGDVGEDPTRIARVLGELAVTQLPVLVVLGNTESRADFNQGLREAQQRFPNVIDLTEVRTVQFCELSLVSLPGYHDPAFVKTKESCVYDRSAVDEVAHEAKRSSQPVALISHGPPRGDGGDALDWARTVNAGDPAITSAIAAAGIRFGFFSNIKEAGGRAARDPEGKVLVEEGSPAATLFLNPGPADTTPWEMNDHRRSVGMAAVFTLAGDQATYRMLRLDPPTAAEKAEARALERQTK